MTFIRCGHHFLAGLNPRVLHKIVSDLGRLLMVSNDAELGETSLH